MCVVKLSMFSEKSTIYPQKSWPKSSDSKTIFRANNVSIYRVSLHTLVTNRPQLLCGFLSKKGLGIQVEISENDKW